MLNDLKNSFDFYIRNKFHFSRKGFVEKNLKLIERNIQENLYTKDVLEKCFEKKYKSIIRALDIGSKNWFYARGEYEFFKSFCDEVFLDGVELDAFRLYSNFYNRYEVAKYHTKGLKNVNYIAGNLLNIKTKYDYIIWFLPFVVEYPHIMWGLPKKYFYPKKLLEYAFGLLNPQGQILIVNQGEYEAQVQRELLDSLEIDYTDLGEIVSEHFRYKHKRYGILVNNSDKNFS